jgi:hypothetical protein
MTKYPFEVSFSEVEADIDPFIDAVFSSLQSAFMVMPQGEGFVAYPVFEQGYEALKRTTGGFKRLNPDEILKTIRDCPISFVVLRAILGFTPPEWACVASQGSGTAIGQGQVRALDRQIRTDPLAPLKTTPAKLEWMAMLVKSACRLITEGAPKMGSGSIHRLDKSDTRDGISGVQSMAELGAPYAMLLYERYLGRPFAGHRDSVSEKVGDVIETAIEELLTSAGIQFRKTKRAEKVRGFDQAPDFIIPDEFSPQVVIEAKFSEDDGTARDKVTRVQHLRELSNRRAKSARFEVIACIDGRGFGVRREDMKKLLRSTQGKVFTLKTISSLLTHSRLAGFRTK